MRLFVGCFQATMDVGGFSRVWELNEEWGRINFWK